MAKREINTDDLPSLESMLSRIEALSRGVSSFELFVPRRMTLQGRRVCSPFPEAVALDRLLQKGLVPVGGERQGDGKLLRLEPESPLDPSTLRTEPPPIDITERIPALCPLAKTTIRLHPRRAVVSDLAASKLGGSVLWPRSEPWPRCDDPRHQTGAGGRRSATDDISPLLVGVVQLNARDFPKVPFRPGTDLLQLLWCPTTEDVHHDAYTFPKLFAYWRNSEAVTDPIPAQPLPDFVETISNHFPVSCRFFPESVAELPMPGGLSRLPNRHDIHDALTADESVWYQYQSDLSACPSTKLGGHPYWIQNDDTPVCGCGGKMDFLLQLCDWEYTNTDVSRRWIPLADRWAVDEWKTNAAAEAILRPPCFDFGHEVYYIFVCPRCPDRPVRFIYQR
jgi:hypothetical protein